MLSGMPEHAAAIPRLWLLATNKDMAEKNYNRRTTAYNGYYN